MKTLLIIFALLATVLIGVASKASDAGSDLNACAAERTIATSCLIDAAQKLLVAIGDQQDKLDGTIEVALAMSTADRRQEAEDMLTGAWKRLAAPASADIFHLEGLSALAVAAKNIGSYAVGSRIADEAIAFAEPMENTPKKWDFLGKLAAVYVAGGNAQAAGQLIEQMPESDYAYAAYKARSIREMAAQFAKQSDFYAAQSWIGRITMGLPYYRATARTDVANHAIEASNLELANKLAAAAAAMAPTFENGYFVAGALREVGEVFGALGDHEQALSYFERAFIEAQLAPSKQEMARAISRIATGLSDHGYYRQAAQYLDRSITIANEIATENLRSWTMYEIAGSAAFAGEFEMAAALLQNVPNTPFSATQSLRSSAKRDLAWGFAKHGKPHEALAVVSEIETKREKIQALSRVIRAAIDPKMKALPRYL